MAKHARARKARVAACAPARKKPARPAHLPSPLRYRYTPELLAHGRYRYEHTEDSIPDIALDFGIHKTTFQRMARREGWVRYVPPPRDLPPAVKLAAQAEALEARQAALTLPPRSGGEGRPPELAQQATADGVGGIAASKEPPNPSPPFAARMGGGEESAAAPAQEDAGSAREGPPQEPLPPPPVTIERLHRDALAELAAVERMRAMLDAEPQSPLDAERTARTLSSLTVTLQRIQRMQCGLPITGAENDDDLPADLDAFRDALAQRIEAYFASTPDEDAAGDAAGARPDVPRA